MAVDLVKPRAVTVWVWWQEEWFKMFYLSQARYWDTCNLRYMREYMQCINDKTFQWLDTWFSIVFLISNFAKYLLNYWILLNHSLTVVLHDGSFQFLSVIPPPPPPYGRENPRRKQLSKNEFRSKNPSIQVPKLIQNQWGHSYWFVISLPIRWSKSKFLQNPWGLLY